MIAQIGLLNSKGMEVFYPIFKDVQNMRNTHYKDKFPTLPFPNKPTSADRGNEYRQRLEEVFTLKHLNRLPYTNRL
jgi:hypothetical protein